MKLTSAEARAVVERIERTKGSLTARLRGETPASAVGQIIPIPKLNLDGHSTDENRLNKTERAWLAQLRLLRYPQIGIQNVTFKLADDCRLTPDFSYINPDGRFTLDDVKGFQREDALIKMKVAARLFPCFTFQIVFRNGSGWAVKDVKP